MTTKVLRALLVLAGCLSAGASTGACPQWSSKFDRITNPEVLREMRSRGDWDQLIEQSGGPEAVILQARSLLLDAQTRLKTAREAERQLAADNAQRSVTWRECQDPRSALMAARCEMLNMQELIWSLEGTIELARCRARR